MSGPDRLPAHAMAQEMSNIGKPQGEPPPVNQKEGTGKHRVFWWVQTNVGFESVEMEYADVVDRHGVPATVLLNYVRNQLDNESALRALPFALVLVFLFALMFVAQDKAVSIRSIDEAIDFDIEENANFAFSAPGNMGHKNMLDVNSIADFWSWVRLGLGPLLFKDYRPVSESSDLDLGNLTILEKRFFLWHNRIIGGLWMRQEITDVTPCSSEGLQPLYGLSCTTEAVGFNLDLEPEENEVAIMPIKIAPEKTTWLRVIESQEAIVNRLMQMEKDRWVTTETTRVELAFLVYNAPKDVLALTNINFMFARSGHIWKQITHRTIAMTPYLPMSTVIFDLMFYSQIIMLTVLELKEVLSEMRQPGGMMNGLRNYIQFWNIVDWLSIILAYTLLLMWIIYCTMQGSVSEELKTVEAEYEACVSAARSGCDASLESFYEKVQDVGDFSRSYRLMGGCYPILIMLRLFKAFAAQPRLAVVSNTLSSSFPDVFHFGVVFLSLFITYSVMGTVLFGREVRSFVTVFRAAFTCFRALMGDFDVEGMFKVGRFITILYFGSFMIIVLLLMLNMLLAIIMDVYGEVKGRSASSEALWVQTHSLVRRYRQKRRGERVDLGVIVTAYQGKYGDDIFDSNQMIMLDDFVGTVPGIPTSQARRLLYQSAHAFVLAHEEPLSMHHVMSSIHHTMSKIWELVARFEKSEEKNLEMEVCINHQLAEIRRELSTVCTLSPLEPSIPKLPGPPAVHVIESPPPTASTRGTGGFNFASSPSVALSSVDVVRLSTCASVDELLRAARIRLEAECGFSSFGCAPAGSAMVVESLEALRHLCRAAKDKACLSPDMVSPAEMRLITAHNDSGTSGGQNGVWRGCTPCK